MKVKITGTGSCLPKLRVTNDDLGQIMETSDEWIRSRTGIIARHIAVEETTTGMSTEAAGKALKNADISAEDVDIIIAATVSADKHLPGLACEVQKNIGAENAVAFDINAACSGFLFALDTAALYLEHGGYQHGRTGAPACFLGTAQGQQFFQQVKKMAFYPWCRARMGSGAMS